MFSQEDANLFLQFLEMFFFINWAIIWDFSYYYQYDIFLFPSVKWKVE